MHHYSTTCRKSQIKSAFSRNFRKKLSKKQKNDSLLKNRTGYCKSLCGFSGEAGWFFIGLTEPSADIIGCARVVRTREDLFGLVVFDGFTEQEKRGFIRNAARLLHIVRDNDNGVVFL